MGTPSLFRVKPTPALSVMTPFTTRSVAAAKMAETAQPFTAAVPRTSAVPAAAIAASLSVAVAETIKPQLKIRPPQRTVTDSTTLPDTPLPTELHTPYSDTLVEHNDSAIQASRTYVAVGFASSEPPNQPAGDEPEKAHSPSLRLLNSAKNLPKGQATGTPGNHTAAVRLPGSRHLLFDVSGESKKFPYSANADLLWTQDGSNYSARLAITAFLLGSRIQTSAGQLTAEGLAPQRFSDKVKTEVAAHFERDKGIVSFSANTPDAPLQPGAQDRLSVLLQLGSLLAGAPQRYPVGSSISIQTIGPKDADDWRFTVGEEQTLTLPEGDHKTRKLSRIPQREHDVQVDVWLASDLAYLPVQLRLTQDNGDFVQLQLKSVATP